MSSKQINVDGKKLADAFKKRGMPYSQAARECGYESNYFAKAAYRGKMSKSAAVMLQALYRMERTEYEPESNPVTIGPGSEVQTADNTRTVDFDSLYNVIYEAVYQAVKKAWSE